MASLIDDLAKIDAGARKGVNGLPSFAPTIEGKREQIIAKIRTQIAKLEGKDPVTEKGRSVAAWYRQGADGSYLGVKYGTEFIQLGKTKVIGPVGYGSLIPIYRKIIENIEAGNLDKEIKRIWKVGESRAALARGENPEAGAAAMGVDP